MGNVLVPYYLDSDLVYMIFNSKYNLKNDIFKLYFRPYWYDSKNYIGYKSDKYINDRSFYSDKISYISSLLGQEFLCLYLLDEDSITIDLLKEFYINKLGINSFLVKKDSKWINILNDYCLIIIDGDKASINDKNLYYDDKLNTLNSYEIIDEICKIAFNFPKLDLHIHFEGSFRPKTIWNLAKSMNIDIQGNSPEEYEKIMRDDSYIKSQKDFFDNFRIPIDTMQTKESLIQLSEELVEDISNQNIRYAEIRLCPKLHTKRKLSQEKVVEYVLEGINRGTKNNSNININLILCIERSSCDRDISSEYRTIDIAKSLLSKGVVAVDIWGESGREGIVDYFKLADYAKENNVPIISHLGEYDGILGSTSACMWGKFKRISHPSILYEDPSLLYKLSKNKLPIEICISSDNKDENIKYNNPCYIFYKLGIPIILGTDYMSKYSLLNEYDIARSLGFTYEDLIKINLNSIEYSFMDKDLKNRLSEEIGLYLSKIKDN